MDSPICDFVRKYAVSDSLRLHMPGHKGRGFLGVEQLDITEIAGADSLYEADGIIQKSEENASQLFGCKTLYSTEGSSQCIRAMLYMAMLHAKQTGKAPLIAAGRNAHKTFLSAAALLDLDVMWLYPERSNNYLACDISADGLDEILKNSHQKPTAVYLTSPDYLGNISDIKEISKVCRKNGVLLLVDNAHGAYLRFLQPSIHPIDLGADACCDSAHKTLPVLTGGAYLHISDSAPEIFKTQTKNALALFGSTSPSYLILQSLDAANLYLTEYRQKLVPFLKSVENLKEKLKSNGYTLVGNEPLKVTVDAKKQGYSGRELERLLLDNGIVPEFSDPDYLVLMLTPETGEEGVERLNKALSSIPILKPIDKHPPEFCKAQRITSIRQAALSVAETLPTEKCEGRVLAAATVGCPPAVPILVCGERIDRHAIECFKYYDIQTCSVISE